MTIPAETMERWLKLQTHGDFKRISDQTNIPYQRIWYAFDKGKCSPKTFTAIADFYAEREEMLREYMD